MRVWTQEEKTWLKKYYPKYMQKELLERFNKRFNANVTYSQFQGALKRYRIRSGRSGQFVKGQPSWNKGLKGIDCAKEGGKRTQFKKGHKPYNYLPVGTECVVAEGYVKVKVADPNTWRFKQYLVWEQAYGPVPTGHCLLFLDGNKQNVTLENLQLITRAQLSKLNQNKLISNIPEVTLAGVALSAMQVKMGEIERKQKGEKE